MSSQESKKRPSATSAGKPSGKRSKFDPKNIAAPPAKIKLEGEAGKRRSVRQIQSTASAASSKQGMGDAASSSSSSPVASSSRDPGNKTIISDDSSCDEVFECALQVNAAQAVEMAESGRQKRRANEALLKEVRKLYKYPGHFHTKWHSIVTPCIILHYASRAIL